MSTVDRLYDALDEWASDQHLTASTHDFPEIDGRCRKLTINGTLSVQFRDTVPNVIVEWGDSYRGDFVLGLPAPALIGLTAGFLGLPIEVPWRADQ